MFRFNNTILFLVVLGSRSGGQVCSPFRLTSFIYAEKFEFENPGIMDDKQCKQTEQFSIITKGSDYFLLLDNKSK